MVLNLSCIIIIIMIFRFISIKWIDVRNGNWLCSVVFDIIIVINVLNL